MDYNQSKASGSYRCVAGPRVRARTVVCRTARLGSYRRAAGPHELAVCCVSLLCQFVVSRFVERGFICLLLSFL